MSRRVADATRIEANRESGGRGTRTTFIAGRLHTGMLAR